MFKVLILSLILFFISFANADCNLAIPEKIITTSNNGVITKWAFPNQNCDEAILSQLHSFFTNLDGEIQVNMLSQILTLEFKTPINVKSTSDNIKIISLKSVIKNHFTQTNNEILNASFLHIPSIFGLNKSDLISIDCDPCQFVQNENFNIVIKKLNGETNNILAQATFEKMVEAYESTKTITAFNELIPAQSFRKKLIPQKNFQNVFTDMEHLNFYRTNKMLKIGDILYKSDLNVIPLVKAGEKTEIIFLNSNLSLKTFGIARQHGGFDETIEVINPINQKKFLGKVIDNKKIVVEL